MTEGRERNEHRSELHTLSIQVAKYKRNNFMRIMIVNVFLVIALIAMFLSLRQVLILMSLIMK